MLEAKTIKRYSKKSIPSLIKTAVVHFHKFIRLRDQNKGCVSCNGRLEEAGHFYSGGHYSALRFLEYNVHGQCKRCNWHLHGNLNEYRKNITDRIGVEGLKSLDEQAGYYKRNPFKWDRFDLIMIIEKYKLKNKQ